MMSTTKHELKNNNNHEKIHPYYGPHLNGLLFGDGYDWYFPLIKPTHNGNHFHHNNNLLSAHTCISSTYVDAHSKQFPNTQKERTCLKNQPTCMTHSV